MAIEQVTEPIILDSTGQQMLTALETIAQKVDVAKSSTLRDVPFGVGTSDWTVSGGNYVATVSSTYVTATSREWVTFDDTFRSYAKGDISVDKVHGGGGITLTTSAVPSGTIQGVLYIIDTDDGKVPVLIEGTVTPIENGGTGQSTLSGAQNALGISALSDRVDTLNSKLTTTSFSVTRNEQNTTSASYFGRKAGNCCVISIDCTTNANSGWVTIGTSSEKPDTNIYGVIADTSGTSTLLVVTLSGEVQIFSPTASNYIGQIVFCV